MSRRHFGLVLAGLIVAIDVVALTAELVASLAQSFALHRSLAEALYLHFRYFTILSNWGVVLVLLATLLQAARKRPAPHSSMFAAALLYILVVCITYEAILRGTPQGWRFYSDLTMHDLVPACYLAFWLGIAPKGGLGLRDMFAWLAVPVAYFVMTLVAGIRREGYPYGFLDPGEIGYRGLMASALLFVLAFLLLGFGIVQLSRVLPDREKSAW